MKQNAKFITTEYVIIEIGNCLSRLHFRKACIKLIENIRESEDIEIINVDNEIFDKAWTLYSSCKDKEWGLTDCTSFIVMNEWDITEAFSTDHHFEQAGFSILLKGQRA
jgi:predicted nucleic acid-binding protein